MNKKLDHWFFKPVDAISLSVFRIMFGALLLFESVNYGLFLCLDCMYRDTSLLFKYQYFEWVLLPPGVGLELLFVVLGLSAICIILGFFYRFAMVIGTLCFTWLFLLDQALYLNHFYLAIIYCVILIFVPAHRHLSLDALRKPAWASPVVPNWGRLLLCIQTEIVLLYAGFVKLNYDWLNLEPMRLWMNYRSRDEALFFQWLTQDWGIAVASYGVIVLHLVGAPLLLWRKTRLVVFLIYCVFHMINALVFNIGIFPFMTIAATLLLFDPDWPRQFARWLLQAKWTQHFSATRIIEVLRKIQHSPKASYTHAIFGDSRSWRAFVVFSIVLWSGAQLLVPLRHFVAPGAVAWNEDGHRFSWRMKLRSKQGIASFVVISESGHRVVVDPADHLNRRQTRTMACIPDLLWQFAQHLETQHNDDGKVDVAVYVDAMCSLNTREPAPLVNRLVDLTSVRRDDPVTDWVRPSTKPLPNPIF